MEKFDSVRLDMLLKTINECEGGRAAKKPLLDEEKSPDDWLRAIRFLVDEGYIKEFDDYFEITYKGRILVHDGGFGGNDTRERVLFYCAIIAAVCSFLGLAISLVALLR